MPTTNEETTNIWKIVPGLLDHFKELLDAGLSYGRAAADLTSYARNLGFRINLTRSAAIGKASRAGIKPARRKNPPKHVIARTYNKGVARTHLGVQEQFNATYVPAEYPAYIDDLSIPKEQRRTLLQLRAHDCRFPIGDVSDPEFFFCGAQRVDGSSYCDTHSRRCFAPVQRRLPTAGFRR